MTPLDALTKRVHDAEQQMLRMMKERVEDAEESLQHRMTIDAFVHAIRSLASEIAGREGISAELFANRFQALCRWHLDDVLRKASDIAPNLMGQLDCRETADIPTDDSPPSVLAPPPEAGPK